MKQFKQGDFLYGIPSSEESAKYHPEGERVFIFTGHITGDGYGILIGWHDHKICKSSGWKNFMWGGDARKATDEEVEDFMRKVMYSLSRITDMTLGQFRDLTQYLPNSVELNIVHGDEYFPVNCFVGRGNTLTLSPGGYDKMADAENTFVALARLGRENFAQQYLNTPKVK